MKNKITFTAVFAFASVLVLAIPSFASDVYKAALTSSDAGSTNTGDIGALNRKATLQCAIPACYRTGTSTPLAANCATDYVLPINGYTAVAGQPPKFERSFDMGGDRYVVARATDGGNPDCLLFLNTQKY